MMFVSMFHWSIYYLLIILIRNIICDPLCIYNVGNDLKLDIRTLGFANGKEPKYDRIPTMSPSTNTLSWNGCFSYSKSDHGNCSNAAACYSKLNFFFLLVLI
jgi:hypothetical protein